MTVMYKNIEKGITALEETIIKLTRHWIAQIERRESVSLIYISLRRRSNDHFPHKRFELLHYNESLKTKKEVKEMKTVVGIITVLVWFITIYVWIINSLGALYTPVA